MLDWKYLLLGFWGWIVDHGLTLATLVVIGVLIPRLGRLIVRIITERMTRGEEQTKSHLAFIGALVYLLEIVAYFFLVYSGLTNLGVSTVGAAVPATVVSAAIGFGAQKVIADFLSGFFIISEHQYGVGDHVSFDGTSDKVTGTVVRLTLRATQIRTGNGELITVPNSQTGITINSSQEWSRAVVDLELPMTGDDTMSSLSDTVSVVTRRAIDDSAVHEDILGEISVLPAMNITAPTAAGLPWTVGMQVTVDVNPATQWKVQRIIRAALLNEFWDRFQAPGDRPSVYSGPPTQEFPPVSAPSGTTTVTGEDALEDGEPRPDAEGPAAAAGTAEATGSGDAATGDGTGARDRATSTTSTTSFDSVAADVAENGIWRNLDTSSRITRVLSVGGRIRPSSGLLVLAIAVIAVVGLLSVNPSGGQPSVLSPGRWTPAPSTSAPVTPTGTPAPETTAPTPTVTPSPTSTSQEDSSVEGTDRDDLTGTGTAAPTTGSGSDASGNGTSPTSEPTPSSPFRPDSLNRNSGGDGGAGAAETESGR